MPWVDETIISGMEMLNIEVDLRAFIMEDENPTYYGMADNH